MDGCSHIYGCCQWEFIIVLSSPNHLQRFTVIVLGIFSKTTISKFCSKCTAWHPVSPTFPWLKHCYIHGVFLGKAPLLAMCLCPPKSIWLLEKHVNQAMDWHCVKCGRGGGHITCPPKQLDPGQALVEWGSLLLIWPYLSVYMTGSF